MKLSQDKLEAARIWATLVHVEGELAGAFTSFVHFPDDESSAVWATGVRVTIQDLVDEIDRLRAQGE